MEVRFTVKYWIDTFQFTGIAMLAAAFITKPPHMTGIAVGLWLVVFAYLLNLFTGK